ncbi:hypothetical protein ACQ4LE_004091 [Meloidogyne hapla]|uniref:Carbonic anhydrase n=1 Tax=Meloidogyne hapla TaxID=6305 RepID=A0A1I8B4G4_MELHA
MHLPIILIIPLLLINLKLILSSGVDVEWGYEEHNGPHTWDGKCKEGMNQSPIDIQTKTLKLSCIDKLQFVNYNNSGDVELKNTGYGVIIKGFEKWDPKTRPYITRGGLNSKYVLLQYHLHWAADHLEGSEHTIDGEHYPVELHLVHVKEGYTLAEDLEKPDGIAVVGFFMKLGKTAKTLENLEKPLKSVIEYDTSTTISNFNIGSIPKTLDNFYRYQGSLTTPSCSESVTWTINVKPLNISKQQLELLRSIHGKDYAEPLKLNKRPTQPINGRGVQFRSKLCKKIKNNKK